MVSGAIRDVEYWNLLFRKMSDQELCDEYNEGRVNHNWHETDRETGQSKSNVLAHEMARRFWIQKGVLPEGGNHES
jgi:hypothetical protein